MASGAKRWKGSKDRRMRAERQGAAIQAGGTSEERLWEKATGRGRQNYNRQKTVMEKDGPLLSCTLGMRQATQGFFQLQEVFSMPYL